MALTKVIGAGLGTVTEDQVFGGATPTVTIGDAGAEDAKIVFDGNAQDFHIGLDDSADSLTIGLGSALGTTSHMVIDAAGAITKPLQPAFMVHPGATAQNNFAASAITNVDFGTERFDLSGDFASNTFTAPVSGVYHFDINLNFNGFDQDFTYVWLILATSNSDYYIHLIQGNMADDDGYMNFGGSILADMDASDTAFVKLQIQGGAAQMDIITQTSSSFSGYLVA